MNRNHTMMFKVNGEVDILSMYFYFKTKLPFKLLGIVAYIFTVVLIYYAYPISDFRSFISITFCVLFLLVVMSFNVKACQTMVALYLSDKYTGYSLIEEQALYYYNSLDKEPLCYAQELVIDECKANKVLESFSYFEIKTGVKVIVYVGTDMVNATVIKSTPIFNNQYLERIELTKEDLV